MISLKTVSDVFKKENQDVIQNFVNNFGERILFVFDLKEENILAIYFLDNFYVNDEQNRKNFFVKGKIVDIASLIQKNGWQYSFKDELEKVNSISAMFSDNLFGFIGFGVQGY